MRSKTHGAPSGGPIDAYLALAYGDLSGRLKGAYVLIGYTPPLVLGEELPGGFFAGLTTDASEKAELFAILAVVIHMGV